MTDTLNLSAADLIDADGEPRIADLRLAAALGYTKAHNIRALIESHREALTAFGEVFCERGKPSAAGGRPGREYHLNRRQALYITAKSDTPRAALVTVQMVEIFDAWRAGRLVPAPTTPDLPWWSQPVYGDRPVGMPSVIKMRGHLLAVDLQELPAIGDWVVVSITRPVLPASGAGPVNRYVRDLCIGRYVGAETSQAMRGQIRCTFAHLPGERMEESSTAVGHLVGRIVPPEMIGAEHAGPLTQGRAYSQNPEAVAKRLQRARARMRRGGVLRLVHSA